MEAATRAPRRLANKNPRFGCCNLLLRKVAVCGAISLPQDMGTLIQVTAAVSNIPYHSYSMLGDCTSTVSFYAGTPVAVSLRQLVQEVLLGLIHSIPDYLEQ
jgi:hypothetical protein